MISVFKTNIEMHCDFLRVLSHLNSNQQISLATIDLEDEDRVLRLEHNGLLSLNVVNTSLIKMGFFSEELIT
jgi:hypothetical protein